MNQLHIDFISDVSCPWCAIGLNALLQALVQVQRETPDAFQVSLAFLPFELNPDMPQGGQDMAEHLTVKYGSTAEQQAQIKQTLRERGQDVGFAFSPDGRGRTYNTFDAHRLLHWAGLQGAAEQLALKQALLAACHAQRQAMDEHAVLLACVQAADLDTAEAQAVLTEGRHADEVRATEAEIAQAGIRAVPAVVVNQRHLISGGQPVAHYVRALCEIAAKGA